MRRRKLGIITTALAGVLSSNSITNAYSLYSNECLESKVDHINKATGAEVRYVPLECLPSRYTFSGERMQALGAYNTKNHVIYIARNIPGWLQLYVYFHEEAHARGIRNEREADEYAAQKTGIYIKRDYEKLRKAA